MDLQEFFRDLPESRAMEDDMKELFEKVMAIKNPMDFDDDFATDEELEALENRLDIIESKLPAALQFKTQLVNSKAVQSLITKFI